MSIEVTLPFEQALTKTVELLKEQGFGVLTEIDVKETLKKKLDVDFKKYQILGACNPPYAYQALNAEEDIGLLLPCNVIVYELDENTTRVSAIDPQKAMAMVSNNQVEPIAIEIKEKLTSVLNAFSA
ncbi:MAG: DUF302 domain-containing protein [FCB group bacterium]|nr:DUF302 domain-containing protein [FCB group bacterium]